MKFPLAHSRSNTSYRLVILVLLICGVATAATARFSSARSPATITVTNNSNYQIRHLYLSSVDRDDWGPDQLNDSVLSPGASFTISTDACNGSEIKVVSEDADGCFLSKVVACSDNAVWTITGDDRPNCGN